MVSRRPVRIGAISRAIIRNRGAKKNRHRLGFPVCGGVLCGGAGGNQRTTLPQNPPSIFSLRINGLTESKTLQGIHSRSDVTPKCSPECISFWPSSVGSHLRTPVQFRIFPCCPRTARSAQLQPQQCSSEDTMSITGTPHFGEQLNGMEWLVPER